MNFISELYIASALQIIIALGLLNVWIIRFHKPTPYRGGGAGSMREEFHTYGLPIWFMYVVGALKIGIAGIFLAGLWVPAGVVTGAWVLVALMLGALFMHIKVRDSWKRSMPALGVLVLALVVILLG
jgi:hypothetical protein